MTHESENNRLVESEHDLPVHFVDGLRIWSRKDGMHLIEVGMRLPSDKWHSQARFMVSADHLQSMIRALCLNTDYYPERPQEASKPA